MKLLHLPMPFQSRATSKFDADLNLSACNRYNNADLTLTLRLFLNKIDPPGGSASVTYPDHNGTAKKIIPWGAYFGTWKQRFQRDCEKAWHGKFWLKCPDSFEKWDFEDKYLPYRPNLWCRFRLQFVGNAASAHHTIRCVRLHSSESFFRSNATLYDDRDTKTQPKAHGSPFKTHVHEVGHLLGLPHVGVGGPPGVGTAICALHVGLGGSTNDEQCYGIIPEEQRDVMGSGSQRRPWHAKPWREAAALFSGINADKWAAVQKRYYPRGLMEIGLPGNGWHTSKPNRT